MRSTCVNCFKLASSERALVGSKSIVKQSIVIGSVVSTQLLAQFVAQLMVIRIVGVGAATDVYLAAQAMPLVVGSIVTVALQSVWLPRLAVSVGDEQAWRREQAIAFGQSAVAGLAFALVLGSTGMWWIPVLYPGFTGEQVQATAYYSIVFLAGAFFNLQSGLLTAALRAKGRFIAAELAALFGTLVSLGALVVLLPRWGIMAGVWVSLFRAVVIYFAQMHLAHWPQISMAQGWSFQQTWASMRPLLLGASIYKTSPLVDRYWASQAATGSITIFSFAQTAMASMASVLERAICTPLIPPLSRLVAKGDFAGLRRTYRQGIWRVSLVSALVVSLIVLLQPLFEKACMELLRVTSDVAGMIWMILLLLVGYLHVSASGTVAVAAFYAMNDTKTPVRIGLIGFVASLALKALGFVYFALPGLALATSIYYASNLLATCLRLEKEIDARLS